MKWSRQTKENIQRQYLQLKEEVPELEQAVYLRIEQEEAETALLLKYLYSNMPLSDSVDYSYEMFRSFAEHGKKLSQEVPWRKKEEIPEEIFLDYVVFHRVNTESLTFCRELFSQPLWERVKGKEMEDAILEANYWCAEEATYQATDDRTMSAEGVWRGAFGRCGEESVFTVNVLRSIGIPARQVYAHRWAHCDDNHAWVEVWCDGAWHFLGACEPEEVLDRGWFLNASSRAMMINSRMFGEQMADGEIIEKNGITTAVNQLKRYAKTTHLSICVKDGEGRPVSGAAVSFALLNYAELVPIAHKETDDSGRADLETGFGSLFVSATKDEYYAEIVVDVAKETEYTLVLEKRKELDVWNSFDMNAPHGDPVHTKKLTEEQKAKGKKKFEKAVEKRLQKVAEFPGKEAERAILLSRGNAKEVQRFLESSVGTNEEKEWMLSQLTIKDFRDCKAEILEEHLACALLHKEAYEKEIFVPYILNPRVSIESLGKYRKKIEHAFSEEEKQCFQKQPEQIWTWIQEHVREVNSREYHEIFTTPLGCMEYRVGTSESKKILFVAMARTFGIPARLDPVTGEVQYWKQGAFAPVQKETGKSTGKIKIYSEDDTCWSYLQNWSIAKSVGKEEWKTLKIEEGYQGDILLDAEAGLYRVLTSNRLPNGNQFAARMEIQLNEGEEKCVGLSLREAKLEEMLDKNQLDPFSLQDEMGEEVPVQKLLQHGMQLLIWAEVGKEPTEHIFNEMRERKEEFATFHNTINVILQDSSDVSDPTFEKTKKELPNLQVYYDNGHENVNVLARRMYGDPDKLPLILVVDEEQNGIYSTSGYNVGTGDMLLRILKNLK